MEHATTAASKWVTWRDKIDVEIRPLNKRDLTPFIAWIRSLDDRELAKLPCDVHDAGYPAKLREQISTGSVHRLIAMRDGKDIVGSMALYRGDLFWIRHTGRLIVVTDPSVRRSGIAVVMFDEMLRLAEGLGVRKLYAELTSMHSEARKLARRVGFRREATLRDHVLDSDGRAHNLCIYSISLGRAKDHVSELMGKYVRLDPKI